jgi:hypothetical protein
LQAHYSIEKRTKKNWRLIFKTPEVNVCLALRLGNWIPQYREAYHNFINVKFPNHSFTCPVKPGKYYVYDVVRFPEVLEENPITNGFEMELPNGNYRMVVKLANSLDPYIFSIQWYLEVF